MKSNKHKYLHKLALTCPIQLENWYLEKSYKNRKSISSSELHLRNEISYLENTFTECNNFPLEVINNIIDQELSQPAQQKTIKPQSKETQQTLQLMVPYSGNQGHKLLSKKKKTVKENTTRRCKYNDKLQERETVDQISSQRQN